MTTIAMNRFARRHTATSRFSHFSGTEAELLALVTENFAKATPGYRPGVVLVPVPAKGFFSGVTEVTTETPLTAKLTRRREGEAPFVEVTAKGPKLPAEVVEVVLYSHETLAEGGEAETAAEWEVISINARSTAGPEPLTPVAMARNFLGLPGGTKAEYTAEEFAKAIVYWSTRANLAE